jgi:hypothetical protein
MMCKGRSLFPVPEFILYMVIYGCISKCRMEPLQRRAMLQRIYRKGRKVIRRVRKV